MFDVISTSGGESRVLRYQKLRNYCDDVVWKEFGPEKALVYEEECLAWAKLVFGYENNRTAASLYGMSCAYWRLGDLPRAEALCREALTIFERLHDSSYAHADCEDLLKKLEAKEQFRE